MDLVSQKPIAAKRETKKETLSKGMYVIRCSKCGGVCASASERSYLPNWSTCDVCFPPIKLS